jgi:uncharacterized damage-inducible protein DinB
MSLAQLIDAYQTGIQPLWQAVAGMTRDQLLARPIPGKWSTIEVVCHLADFEPVYADRMKRVIAEEQPLFLSADQERFVAKLAYHQRDLEEELNLMEITRKQMSRILQTLPDEARSRFGTYQSENQTEKRTLEQLLSIITRHVPHHLQFILEKRRALGLG